MSRGPYPILLMLAMSLPGAVRALGLGDIRVDSALNEPLSAQIDIVGATREELVELTAKVANREMFQRYGADRPSFGVELHLQPLHLQQAHWRRFGLKASEMPSARRLKPSTVTNIAQPGASDDHGAILRFS